ncbi:hypothetical protein PSTT_15858, partial [Puccinia striiformis]
MQQVGEKWRGLTEASSSGTTTEIFSTNCVAQSCATLIKLTKVDSTVKVQQTSKSDAKALAVCKKWIKDVTQQLVVILRIDSTVTNLFKFNHLRADHQVEGFVLIVSSDAAGSVFLHGGTPLGQIYMDILKARYECWKKFHIWVTGMTVDAELNPMARSIKNLPQRAIEPWEAGDASQRKTVMREKLRCLLLKSTEGKRSRGWPAKARSILQELKLVLKIQPDDVDPASASKQTHCSTSTDADIPDDTHNVGSAHLVASFSTIS